MATGATHKRDTRCTSCCLTYWCGAGARLALYSRAVPPQSVRRAGPVLAGASMDETGGVGAVGALAHGRPAARSESRRKRDVMSTAGAVGRDEPHEKDLTPEEMLELMGEGGGRAASLANLDVLTVLTLIGGAMVITCLHDRRADHIGILLSVLTVLLLALSRFLLAWWDIEGRGRDWRSYLLWRNIGVFFWLLQLVYALTHGPEVVAAVHQRLTSVRPANLIMFTNVLAGFLMGAEPGALHVKLATGALLIVLISARLYVLFRCAPSTLAAATPNAAEEMLQRGLVSLLLAPLLGCLMGLVTRCRLDAQREKLNELESALAAQAVEADELNWLRNHAFELEAARKQSLLRQVAGPGETSSGTTARRRSVPRERDAASLDGISEG